MQLNRLMYWMAASICLSGGLYACDDDDNDDDQDALVDAGSEDAGELTSNKGHTILSYIKTVSPSGQTSRISLNAFDIQTNQELDLVALNEGVLTCDRSCLLSPNLDYVGWLKTVIGGDDLYIAPIDISTGKIDSSAMRKVASQVHDYQFTQNEVIYSIGQSIGGSSSIDLKAVPLDASKCADDSCAQIVSALTGKDSFRVSAQSPLVLIVTVTTSSMTIGFYNLESQVSQNIYTFTSSGGSGSEFSSSHPLGISPDSSYLAIFAADNREWKVSAPDVISGGQTPAWVDLWNAETHPTEHCNRQDPYRFTEVLYNPVFASDSSAFYFVAHGKCYSDPKLNETAINRDDYDILRIGQNHAATVENITKNPHVSSWINQDIVGFDLSPDDQKIAFISSRPDNVSSNSIWLLNVNDGTYDCSRGKSYDGIDGKTRCEFIFEDAINTKIKYRDVKFHVVP